MKKLLIALCLIVALSGVAHADMNEDQSLGLHYWWSAAGSMLTYGFLKEVVKLDKKQALIASAVIWSLLGISKELMDDRIDGRDLAMDAAGIGTTAGLLLVFEF